AADGVRNDYNNRFSNAIDQYDNIELMNINETFGTMRNGEYLATERRADIIANDTIFFRFVKFTQRSYQLEFIPINFAGTYINAVLYDSYNNTQLSINMTQNTIFNFSVNADAASQNRDRFKVIFRVVATGAPLPVKFSSVKASIFNNAAKVDWTVQEELNVAAYAIEKSSDGRNFQQLGTVQAKGLIGQAINYSYTDVQTLSNNQFYRIKSIDTDGRIMYSEVVSLKSNVTLNQNFSVFPNPAPVSNISVQLKNSASGNYQVQIFGANGQPVFQTVVNYMGNNQPIKLNVHAAVKPGMYQMVIVGMDQVKMTQKIIITNNL
ncbi:MAG: T9SS type A sorting domain-containing protein, partial [Ferruginibacter sp.]